MKVRRITSEHLLTIKTGDERRATEMISFLIGLFTGSIITFFSMALAINAKEDEDAELPEEERKNRT